MKSETKKGKTEETPAAVVGANGGANGGEEVDEFTSSLNRLMSAKSKEHQESREQKTSAPLPDYREFQWADPAEFVGLVSQRSEVSQAQSELKKEYERLGEGIKRAMVEAWTSECQVEQFRVVMFPGESRSLDKVKLQESLLEQGVKPSIIKKALMEATKVTKYVSVKVTVGKNGEEAQGDRGVGS